LNHSDPGGLEVRTERSEGWLRAGRRVLSDFLEPAPLARMDQSLKDLEESPRQPAGPLGGLWSAPRSSAQVGSLVAFVSAPEF